MKSSVTSYLLTAKKITSALPPVPAGKSLNMMEFSKEMVQAVIKGAGNRSQSNCLLLEMGACVYALPVVKGNEASFLKPQRGWSRHLGR